MLCYVIRDVGMQCLYILLQACVTIWESFYVIQDVGVQCLYRCLQTYSTIWESCYVIWDVGMQRLYQFAEAHISQSREFMPTEGYLNFVGPGVPGWVGWVLGIYVTSTNVSYRVALYCIVLQRIALY